MSQVFKPEWLENAEFQPVLLEIYKFSKDYGTPPTISVLREIFQKKDKSLYEARFQNTLDKIENAEAELADVLYTIDKARDVAISRSLMDLVNSAAFTEMNEEFDGQGQLRELEKWKRLFKIDHTDLDLDIKEAVEKLVAERGPDQRSSARIPCGISFIDSWSAGGIRPKNLAILLAPTGGGKSIILTIIAHNIAEQGDRVLYITNELSWEESTERFMSKITGTHLDKIIEDPTLGYHGLKRQWTMLSGKLRLLEVVREIDSDEIEAMVMKFIHAYGWRPDVVIIDFMERMKPTVSGVKRDQSWNWLGYIAKDLVRMAKRNNWLIWTAGQSNRKGLDPTEKQNLYHAQGSIQHLQEAALVVGMRQVDELYVDEETKILQFTPLKMRHSKRPGAPIYVEAKLGFVNVTDKIRDPKDWTEKEGEKAGKFCKGKEKEK